AGWLELASEGGAAVRSLGACPPAARRQLEIDWSWRAIEDLRFAAWFLWMTPLLAALSSFFDASRMSTVACSVSPASAASRNLRMAVFNDDFTDLLRSRRFSFCLLRLICDLMFATRRPRPAHSILMVWGRRAYPSGARAGHQRA